MKKQTGFKQIIAIVFQFLGAFAAFLFSMLAASLILPMPAEIMAAAPTDGFLPTSLAFLFNGAVNALILVWAGRRSSLQGLRMGGQLFVLSFVAQVLQTQIETGYFLSAFPLLQGNFEVYGLVLRGLLTSLFFSLLVTWITGGFSKKMRPQPAFKVSSGRAVRQGSWLALVYLALYMLFGYFAAWQLQEVRLFYGGPAELNGFFEQWGASLMQKPELPVFQYMRGFIWMAGLVPLFKGFSGSKVELVTLSGLALALLPTVQLAFANPLMPAAVSLGHFWEVSISTGIYGALCAWALPEAVKPA